MMDNQKSIDFNSEELKVKNVFNDNLPSTNSFKNELIQNHNLDIKEEIDVKKENSVNNDDINDIDMEKQESNVEFDLKNENQLKDQIKQEDSKDIIENICDSKEINDTTNNINENFNNYNEINKDIDSLNKINENSIEMDNEPKDYCENYVNFAIICSFFQQFGEQIGINCSIETLKNMLENEKKIENNLIELHVKLLRKIKKYVNKEKWENGLVKFLYEFSYIDAYELEKNGYQKISLKLKIDLLKNLLEAQFDYNQKFKTEINNIETLLLRLVSIGRDLNGNQYWYHLDEEHTLRIYKEKPDKLKTWNLICQDKDEFTKLIDDVENNKTEVCEISSTDNSENEEEDQIKTEIKKNSVLKEKNKESKTIKSNDKNEEVEKKTRGRKPSKNIKHEKKESVSNENRFEKIEEPKIKKEENLNQFNMNDLNNQNDKSKTENSNKFDNSPKIIIDNDDGIIQETLIYLLDEVEKKLICDTASNEQKNDKNLKTDEPISPLLNETPSKTFDSAVSTPKTTPKTRGRKKKSVSNELSKLMNSSISQDLSDFLPIKRSSRIQKLQEKKKAEQEAQMQFELSRLNELKKNQKMKKKDAKTSEPESEENLVESDVDDEDYEDPNKKKLIDASSDSEFDYSKSKNKKKKRGKRSKKDKNLKFDKKMKKGWSSNEDEEIFDYEEDEEVLKFDENHDEFACEELEEDEEPVILKRARTAKKIAEEENDEECINDDTPCQKCNLYDNPEWILLCDNCNLGYHTACLVPKLYLIPDGDWFCPKCENEQLLIKLKFEFDNYVQNLAKREREKLRKERLKYVEINLGNILTDDTNSNRKSKTKKRIYDANEIEFNDSEDDSEEEDDEENDLDDNEDYDENFSKKRRSRVKNNYKRSMQRVKQRKRRASYSDESQDSQPSESGSQNENDDSSSSNDSQPKQRSARKRVSYQFKEYDELIKSAIQASDYEENDGEADEEEDEEEEYDSDNAKHPYSKGKDIANLIKNASEDPFNPVENKDNKIEVLQKIEEEDSKIKEEIKDKRKNKQKSKRKLNDLDSPVEEAEEDSDFTIKDESNTEFEDEEEEEDNETEGYSNDSDDNSNLSDWGKKSKKSRSKRKPKKSNRKKSKRYNSEDEFSDDDSDYGYKTRKKSKRVSYREVTSTEEDFSDYSDKNDKKSKKNKKKRKKNSSDDFSDQLSDSNDERVVVKKKKSKSKKYSSEDEFLSKSSDEDNKRKSKRTSKKKVYNDYTDIDESQDESNTKLESSESENSLVIDQNSQVGNVIDDTDQSDLHQELKKTPKVKIKLNKSNADPQNSCLVSEIVESEYVDHNNEKYIKENEEDFSVKKSKNEKKNLSKKNKKLIETEIENPSLVVNHLTSFSSTAPDKVNSSLERTETIVNKDSSILLSSNLDMANNLKSNIDLEENSNKGLNKPKSPRAPKVLNTSAVNALPTSNIIVGSNFNPSSLQNPVTIIPHPTHLSSMNPTQQPISNPQPIIPIHHQHQAITHHPIHNAQHPSSTPHYAGLPVPHPHQPNHSVHHNHHYSQTQHPQTALASSAQGIHSQVNQNQHLGLPQHLANLPPQIATQLATQHQQQLASQIAVSGFGIPGYPPHFYDPSFAYFGHHQSPYHHPMNNPYHPSFVPRPSQVPSTHPSIISSSLENRSPVTALPRSTLPSNQQQSLLINSQTSHPSLTQSNSKPTSNSNRT